MLSKVKKNIFLTGISTEHSLGAAVMRHMKQVITSAVDSGAHLSWHLSTKNPVEVGQIGAAIIGDNNIAKNIMNTTVGNFAFIVLWLESGVELKYSVTRFYCIANIHMSWVKSNQNFEYECSVLQYKRIVAQTIKFSIVTILHWFICGGW